MRKFEDIMKEKLHGATSEYSENIWENIRKEIPIAKKSSGRYYWMTAFLFAFALMIFSVQSYPSWKISQESAHFAEVEPLDMTKFILSPEDLNARKLHSNTIPKPTLKPVLANPEAQVLTTQSAVLAEDVPTLVDSKNIQVAVSAIDTRSNLSFDNTTQGKLVDAKSSTEVINDTKLEKVAGEKAPLYTLADISKFNIGLKIPEYKIPARKKGRDNESHCEVLKGKQSRFYLTARHVNSYAFNNMQIKSPAGEEYLSARHASESKQYSFSDELAFGVEYRGGLFAELGLRYDQINEKFSYFDPNARGESTVIVSDTIFTGGTPQVIVDTVTTQLTGLREVVNNNRYRKVSVPLSIGYQYLLNKKVSIAARTGLVLNVWSKFDGKIFDENLEVVSIGERQDSNSPFFNKLVHSVSASAYLQYKMNKRMEFLVGLDGFRNIGSASFDSNPIDQKYSSLGIFVGTKYNL